MGHDDNLEQDATFLEFIFHRIQQMKHDNKEPFLSLKTLPDECDDLGSGSSAVSVRMAITSRNHSTNITIRVVLGVTQVTKKVPGPTPF